MNASLATFLLEFDIAYNSRYDRLWERGEMSQDLFSTPKSKKPEGTMMQAPTGAEDEEDEDGVVRRQYARDTDNVPTVAHIDKTREKPGVGLLYPNFREYQPQIGQYAQANAENMATALIFVICSQGVSWHNLIVWFPEIMDYIRRPRDFEGNKKVGLSPFPKTVPWGQAVVWGREAIDFIWQYRGKLYDSIMQAVAEDKQSGGTGFFVYAKLCSIPGLGIPKAGFAAQLIIGKFGCIDSVNLVVHGGPGELLAPKGGFKNPKAWIKPEKGYTGKTVNKGDTGAQDRARLGTILYGKLTSRGENMLQAYAAYLNKLKRDSQDTACEQLWDDWCELTAQKIIHGGKAAAIDVNFGGTRKSKALVYNDAGDLSGTEGNDNEEFDLGDQRDYSKLKPRAQNLRAAKEQFKRTKLTPGQLVGQHHRDLVKS